MLKKIKYLILLIFLFTTLITTFSFKSTYAVSKKTKITQKDMIYFIMTDRFYDGDKSNDKDVNKTDPSSYQGGDFQGIINKLDYIKSLGFTAIWITPVVKNQDGGYHGYWATDFYSTNEHFGSMEKLKELVNTAHKKGIKVIFDLVVNHTGQTHPWVNDPTYTSWFHDKIDITDYNNQNNVENGWLAGLPDLNQDNPAVKNYLITMAKWWIKQTNIDGYRLDTVKHVSKSFWSDFVKEIKKDYPDFYFVGEVFNNSPIYLESYQETGIDGLLDYPTYYSINSVFKGLSPASDLNNIINQQDTYINKNLMGTFIDNHDVPRFVNNATNLPEERLKSALTFMMTYTGIPTMYYGTEIAMDGGSDPDNRRMMDWSAKSSVTDYVKKLTSIRASNTALTEGDIKVLSYDDNYISYMRKAHNNIVISVFNTSDKVQKVEFDLPKEDAKTLNAVKDLLSNKSYKIINGKVSLTMSPLQSNIFVYKNTNTLIYIAIFLTLLLIVIALIFTFKKKRIFFK